uniref:Uncharacterized protein n=1 Tax=Amazona collaria TaxID=241587 RepID=A0A8B9FVE0_9PSIT
MAPGGCGGRGLFFGAAVLFLAVLLGPAACISSLPWAGSPGEPRSRVQVLGGSNWSLVLQGQWMLDPYRDAPVREEKGQAVPAFSSR